MKIFTAGIGLGLAALAANASTAGQGVGLPQPATSDSDSRLAIVGSVVADGTGMPLSGAVVNVASSQLQVNRSTMSDASGHYEIKGLPAGEYTVAATKGGYVVLAYGQRRPSDPPMAVLVAEQHPSTIVDFRLPRTSVIAGRILDEYGEPVTNAKVTALKDASAGGPARLIPSFTTTTNDLGEFRAFGLTPAQYFIVAQAPASMTLRGQNEREGGYAPTYFPGTTDLSSAKAIDIDVGATIDDASFRLSQARLASISGTAVDSQGRPLSGRSITVLQRLRGARISVKGAPVGPRGQFKIHSLPPGEYLLEANTTATNGEPPEFASKVIIVAGADVDQVLVSTQRIARASGMVTFNSRVSIPAASLQIVAVGIELGGGAGGGTGRVDASFSFNLPVRPGHGTIRVNGLTPEWTVESITLNGIDVTDSGVDFVADRELGGFVIRLTDQVTEVQASVSAGSRDGSRRTTAVVFSRDSAKWGPASRFVRTAECEGRAGCRIRALPPGEYYAVAVDELDADRIMNAASLDALRTYALSFELRAGERKAMALTQVRLDGKY